MVNISEVSDFDAIFVKKTNRNDLVISNVYFMYEIYLFVTFTYIYHLPSYLSKPNFQCISSIPGSCRGLRGFTFW